MDNIYSAYHYQEKCKKSEDACKRYVERLESLLPEKEGNVNKYLYTDGETFSWNEVDLSSKANSDLSNVASVAQSFKEASVAWGLLDYSAGVDITPPTQSAPYTCPCSLAYVACFTHKGANTLNQLYVNGIATGIGFHNSDSFTPNKDAQTIFLEKGDVIYWGYASSQLYSSKIYPLKGVS